MSSDSIPTRTPVLTRKQLEDFLRSKRITSDMFYSKKRRGYCNRVIVWFSCGAASAVAAKLTVQKYKDSFPVHICYCDTGSEHEDNQRFLKDCEKWFNHPIEILKSEKYEDIWDVFEKTRYLVGPKGARCTTELKKVLRHKYQNADTDIQAFGYDITEYERSNTFRGNNFEIYLETPLIDNGLSKQDCLAMIERAGIEIPMMYKLGYKNNNCIGCVKGGAGYWNKIRRDFPSVFNRMIEVEKDIGISIIRKRVKGKPVRIFLGELDPNSGRYEAEPDVSCGLTCAEAYEMFEDDTQDCDEDNRTRVEIKTALTLQAAVQQRSSLLAGIRLYQDDAIRQAHHLNQVSDIIGDSSVELLERRESGIVLGVNNDVAARLINEGLASLDDINK